MKSNAVMPNRLLVSTVLASVLSGAVLVWRSRVDTGHAPAAINAVSHWLWGDEALRCNEVTARETAIGAVVHAGSSMLWAGLFEWLQSRRMPTRPVVSVSNAAAVTAIAATVDLKLVPHRLTPGFQERLSDRSLVLTYAAFAAGLAIAGALTRRRWHASAA